VARLSVCHMSNGTGVQYKDIYAVGLCWRDDFVAGADKVLGKKRRISQVQLAAHGLKSDLGTPDS